MSTLAASSAKATKVTKSQQLKTTTKSAKSAIEQVEVVAPKGSRKQPVENKDPKLAPVINFLNGAVVRGIPDDSQPPNTLQNTVKKITYKEVKSKDKSKAEPSNKKTEDLIIDLNKFSGIQEVKNAYIVASQANAVAKTEEDKIASDGITKAVYDPILRGYLSMADIKFVEKKRRAKRAAKEDVEEEDAEEVENAEVEDAEKPIEGDDIVSDHLDRAIATLGLPVNRTYDVGNFIEAINKVVRDDSTFKIKAFNKSFPLGVHNVKDEPGRVNSKYAQHYLQFFDEVLQHVVENIDSKSVIADTIVYVHSLLCKEFTASHKGPNDLIRRVQYNSFLERFKDDQDKLFEILKCFVAHKKGVNDDVNELTIKKEVKEMVVMTQQGKTFREDPEGKLLSAVKIEDSEDKTLKKLSDDVIKLISNLRKYFLFINIILDGKKYLENSSGSSVNYEEVFDNYKALCQVQQDFIASHSKVDHTVEGLLTYLAQAIVFISRFRNGDNTKTFITASEFNDDKEGIIFKLNYALAKEIKAIYSKAKTDDDIADAISNLLHKQEYEHLAEDLSAVGSIQTFKDTAAENANIFAKIGKLVDTINGVAVNKNTRIAVGLAIVKYIVIETNRLLAQESSKKSALTIYIKF